MESLGFSLLSYIKVTNLHCLAFRKLITSPVLNEEESERISQLLNIPQDAISDDEESAELERKPVVIDEDLFTELPFSID